MDVGLSQLIGLFIHAQEGDGDSQYRTQWANVKKDDAAPPSATAVPVPLAS